MLTKFAAAALALALPFFALPRAAKAELIDIAGSSFVYRCPCAISHPYDEGTLDNGNLVPPGYIAKYVANVQFPVNGQKVCYLSFLYVDTNGSNAITATLYRKAFAAGSNPGNHPTVMATVSSQSGVVPTVRRITTTAIVQPVIEKTNGYYYVQIDSPTSNFIVLAVQVDVKPTC